MCRTNILFRRCSQPGNLTTTFPTPPTEASNEVCQAPKRERLKNTPQRSAQKSWFTNKGMGFEWEGEQEKVSQTLLLGNVQCPACTRAAPSSASGHPVLCRGLRAQSCTYCHVTNPWIKGRVSKHIWTKKFQDFECIGGLELVLRRRDAPTYLEVRSLVREDLWGKTPGVPRWLFNHLGEMVRKERRKWWGCFAVG